MTVAPLVGREAELGVIAAMFDGLPGRGGALVVRGEPGIGKSTLLAHASTLASSRGMHVLEVRGAQSETHLPFAGVHQLLRPTLARLDQLPVLQRDAVLAAFGMTDAAAPDRFLIALAALELLSDAAARSPVAVIVDDAHWLDSSTEEAIAFVGRRVGSDAVILLIAIREGYESSALHTGLPELCLGELADSPARELLHTTFPELAGGLREQVLDEAGGNPLALLELPRALGSAARGRGVVLPLQLPLTTRLEQAFASRAAELPSVTRTILQIAAVDDAGILSEILRAAEFVAGTGETVHALMPAVEAQLVEVDGSTVRFRHPLVRSAIRQAASFDELQAAHAAFVEVLASDPDRRVWHQTAAASGVDPAVASQLEEAAERAQRRGATSLAVAAFERSAALTAERDGRGALLLRAAEAASELGRSDVVARLVRQADSLELGSHDRARSMWLGEVFGVSVAAEPTRTHALVHTAERMMADGAADLALNLLLAAAFRCYWVDPGEQSRCEVLAAADRVGDCSVDPRLILIQAYAAPIARGSVVVDRVRSVLPEAEAAASHLLGTAAQAVGAFAESSSLLATSVARLREQGRLGVLAQVLVSQGWAAISLADWGTAAPAAAEAAEWRQRPDSRCGRREPRPRWRPSPASAASKPWCGT